MGGPRIKPRASSLLRMYTVQLSVGDVLQAKHYTTRQQKLTQQQNRSQSPRISLLKCPQSVEIPRASPRTHQCRKIAEYL